MDSFTWFAIGCFGAIFLAFTIADRAAAFALSLMKELRQWVILVIYGLAFCLLLALVFAPDTTIKVLHIFADIIAAFLKIVHGVLERILAVDIRSSQAIVNKSFIQILNNLKSLKMKGIFGFVFALLFIESAALFILYHERQQVYWDHQQNLKEEFRAGYEKGLNDKDLEWKEEMVKINQDHYQKGVQFGSSECVKQQELSYQRGIKEGLTEEALKCSSRMLKLMESNTQKVLSLAQHYDDLLWEAKETYRERENDNGSKATIVSNGNASKEENIPGSKTIQKGTITLKVNSMHLAFTMIGLLIIGFCLFIKVFARFR